MNKTIKIIVITLLIIAISSIAIIYINSNTKVLQASANTTISNKKIGWGIKRNDNH